MFLVVGLGNPGSEYKNNRHNIGFMAADELFRRYHFSAWRKKFQGEVAEGEIDGNKVLLLKPQTYMNNSGEAVQSAMAFYKIPVQNVVVIHDEMDCPVGKLKSKVGGGAGGHNGIKSIDSHCSPDYTRIRVGVGRPLHGEQVVNWIISDLPKEDREKINALLEDAAEVFPAVLTGGAANFTSRLAVYQQKKGK
ncbi:MAG: aminoacyl-tRNA hydrolase [Alphaproteobacteria bacterium]|nr:aminoacyl-tRNA hydrolase [Alphaproteobacteria bacterium]